MRLTREQRILRDVLFNLPVEAYSPEALLELARKYGYGGSEKRFYGMLARIDQYNLFPISFKKMRGNIF